MTIRNRFIAHLLMIAAMLSFAENSIADTIYSYEGNSYTTATAPYTTSQSLSLEITLGSSLGANVTFFDAVSDIVSFTFFDGVRTVTEASGPFTILEMLFTTNGSGDIVNWSIQSFIPTSFIFSCGPDGASAYEFSVSDCAITNNAIDNADDLGSEFASNQFSPGTWTATVVPEPGSALLIALGLVGLGVRARVV